MSTGFELKREYTAIEYNSNNQYQTLKCLTAELRSPQRNDYKWQVGEVNTLKSGEIFNPFGSCKGGGLYFCNDLENLSKHRCDLICIVSIPEDARVWTEDGKAKTDKLFLEKVYTNAKFIKAYFNDELHLNKILWNTWYLHKFVTVDNFREMVLYLHDRLEVAHATQAIQEYSLEQEMYHLLHHIVREFVLLLDVDLARKVELILTGKKDVFSLPARLHLFNLGIFDETEDDIIKLVERSDADKFYSLIKQNLSTFRSEPILKRMIELVANNGYSVAKLLYKTNNLTVTRIIIEQLYERTGTDLYRMCYSVMDLLNQLDKFEDTSNMQEKIVSVCFGIVASKKKSLRGYGMIIHKLFKRDMYKEQVVVLVHQSKHLNDMKKHQVLKVVDVIF